MPLLLNITAQDLDSSEKRAKYVVGIVGLGQKGVFYANTFAQAGYKVLCTDADASVIKKAAKGKTVFCEPEAEAKLKSNITKGQISVNNDLKKTVALSDIVIIAFTAQVDAQTKADISHTVNACKQVGSALRQGTLVIYGGIASLGFTESTIKETLEDTSGFKAGKDFGLAYNPIQVVRTPINELRVAASDQSSLRTASTILRTLTENVTEISSIRTAEVLTMFSIAKRDVNIALANEFAAFCENANVDYFEILRQLASKESTFAGSIGEENNREEYLLLESADNLNAKLRLPALARQINEEMVKHAVNLTQEALRSCDKTLRRARVAVLGPANGTTGIFVKFLELKGAKVSVYDPAIKRDKSEPTITIKNSLNETIEGADCLVVLSAQERFNNLNLKKLKPLMRTHPVIVDLVGKFDPREVKTEGFIYCGLGRGTG